MSFFNAAKQALNTVANDTSYGNSQDDGYSQGDRQTGRQDYGSSNNKQYSNDVSSGNDGYSQGDRQTGRQDYGSSNNKQYSNDVSSGNDGYSQGGRQTGGQNYNSNDGQQQQGRQYSSNDVSSNNDSNNDGYSRDVRQTGGQQYNAPSNEQSRYNADDVLSHANSNDEDSKYISNAIQHVQDNSGQHQDQVSPADMGTYGPMITKALSSVASKNGVDVGSFISGTMGQGTGNQLMGMVMKEAGNYASSSGSGGQDKQSLMNGAAMTLTKLAAQGQLSSFTGGSNSGGLGGMAANMGKSLLQSRFGQ